MNLFCSANRSSHVHHLLATLSLTCRTTTDPVQPHSIGEVMDDFRTDLPEPKGEGLKKEAEKKSYGLFWTEIRMNVGKCFSLFCRVHD